MVNTTASYYQAARCAAKTVFNEEISEKHALTYAKILELTGNPIKALNTIYKTADKSECLEFLQRWAEAFDGPTTQLLRPIRDAKSVLTAFAEKYLIAVVSQRHQHHTWLQEKLEEYRLIDFVDCSITRLDVQEGKPNPEGILLAQAKLQAKPILMIGDAQNDIIASQKAQLISIGVVTGLSTYEELVTAGANVVVFTLTEALNWFKTNY